MLFQDHWYGILSATILYILKEFPKLLSKKLISILFNIFNDT